MVPGPGSAGWRCPCPRRSGAAPDGRGPRRCGPGRRGTGRGGRRRPHAGSLALPKEINGVRPAATLAAGTLAKARTPRHEAVADVERAPDRRLQPAGGRLLRGCRSRVGPRPGPEQGRRGRRLGGGRADRLGGEGEGGDQGEHQADGGEAGPRRLPRLRPGPGRAEAGHGVAQTGGRHDGDRDACDRLRSAARGTTPCSALAVGAVSARRPVERSTASWGTACSGGRRAWGSCRRTS